MHEIWPPGRWSAWSRFVLAAYPGSAPNTTSVVLRDPYFVVSSQQDKRSASASALTRHCVTIGPCSRRAACLRKCQCPALFVGLFAALELPLCSIASSPAMDPPNCEQTTLLWHLLHICLVAQPHTELPPFDSREHLPSSRSLVLLAPVLARQSLLLMLQLLGQRRIDELPAVLLAGDFLLSRTYLTCSWGDSHR